MSYITCFGPLSSEDMANASKLEFSISISTSIRFSSPHVRDVTHTQRVVVVMITDPVVVNTSTNQPALDFSLWRQHQNSLRQALTGPGGHCSKQLQNPPWQHRSTGWACRRQAARANLAVAVT